MLGRTLAAVLAAAALVCPAGAQDAYLIGVTGAMTGPAASTNGPPIERLASLHGPSQRSRRDQRKENSADRARRSRRAIESGGQRQAAAHSGQRESTSA